MNDQTQKRKWIGRAAKCGHCNTENILTEVTYYSDQGDIIAVARCPKCGEVALAITYERILAESFAGGVERPDLDEIMEKGDGERGQGDGGSQGN